MELPVEQQANSRAANGKSHSNGTDSSNSSSGESSPLVHLQLASGLAAAVGSRKKADALLQAIADRLLHKHGLLVAVPRYSVLDRVVPPPSIKLFVHAGLSMEQVPTVTAAVRESAERVLGPVL